MRVLPCGDAAVLLEVDAEQPSDAAAKVRALDAALRRRRGPGAAPVTDTSALHTSVRDTSVLDTSVLDTSIVDTVPAERTVLLRVVPGTDLGRLAREILALDVSTTPVAASAGASVTVPVVYDGADLAQVARTAGLSEDEVIRAHTESTWTVAFCGFAPGFAYLTGGDPRLAVARLGRPRPRVPRGSVALAGRYSAVYPGESPGGWHLIGRTDLPVWDPDRDPPALLRPGVAVRFRRATGDGTGDRPAAGPPSGIRPVARAARPRRGAPIGDDALTVLDPGPFATVQDRGRPGQARLGVSASGAADRGALALANRLVGNDRDAAGIEATLGGLTVRAGTDLVLAVTGAVAAVDVDGRRTGMHATLRIRAGAVVRLGRPERGLRTYVAVRGGVAVEPVLGSRSFDALSGLGPPPLVAGDELPIGPPGGRLPDIDVAPVARSSDDPVVLTARPGPRAGWLTDSARATLTTTRWHVDADSNRVGVRLDGPALSRRDDREMASEGLVRGAVQVPASGHPVIFLADHPTTGGYPVVAVIDDSDTDRLAQLRPGDAVELRLRRGPIGT